MTSVPNRLQLLNGNNLLIFFLLFASISSCASKKITSTKNMEIIEVGDKIKKKDKDKKVDVVEIVTKPVILTEDSVNQKPVIFDLDNENTNTGNQNNTSTKNSTNTQKSSYNVAVILPFFLDQIPLGMYVDDSTKQLSADSKNAMEFYLGCQMAREKFESESLEANVYFLDDKNDSLTTASLFHSKPFPNVDYIIGPVGFKNLKIVADYAKNNQIPMISPFANSMYIKDNPYYFNANASLKSQYSFILEDIKRQFPNKTVEVIYDGQDSTSENINILKDIASKYYGYAGIKYTSLRAWDDAAKQLAQPDTLSERVILIYSSKDTYVKSIIVKLKALKNHLQVFTSACAKNPKALTDLKTPHMVYTVYPYSNSNPNFSVFDMKYEEKYKKKSTEIANQGYDLMLHLLNTLDKKQTLQDNTYNYTIDFDNTQSKFQFKPVLNKNGDIDYYDNTFMYLYKYANGTFVIATP
jgi:ABC-type branched-subunit amino acid transport system substrate-binding protein